MQCRLVPDHKIRYWGREDLLWTRHSLQWLERLVERPAAHCCEQDIHFSDWKDSLRGQRPTVVNKTFTSVIGKTRWEASGLLLWTRHSLQWLEWKDSLRGQRPTVVNKTFTSVAGKTRWEASGPLLWTRHSLQWLEWKDSLRGQRPNQAKPMPSRFYSIMIAKWKAKLLF